MSVDVFRSIADILEEFPLEERIGTSLLIRQPAGVVAAITPWNYPLYQLAAKLAPALAAGCTTILKPAGAAPLAAFDLAEIIDDLGLPPGTVNVVSGPGREIGDLLAGHPQVDMVSITGSTQAGISVAEKAARTVKRVTLELGGKSAFVLLDDSDLAVALPVAVRSCFVNNGQSCSALTRLIVPRGQVDAVEDGLADLVGAMQVGDPLDAASDVGPVVTAGQRDTIRGYIDQGVAEGATLVSRRARCPRRPRTRVLRAPDGVLPSESRHGDRAGGDLRTGARRATGRRRRPCGTDRERLRLRIVRRCLVQRRGTGHRSRPAHANRASCGQRRALQCPSPLRRLPPFRCRPGTRRARSSRVLRAHRPADACIRRRRASTRTG